jgi:hypothetical protein
VCMNACVSKFVVGIMEVGERVRERERAKGKLVFFIVIMFFLVMC